MFVNPHTVGLLRHNKHTGSHQHQRKNALISLAAIDYRGSVGTAWAVPLFKEFIANGIAQQDAQMYFPNTVRSDNASEILTYCDKVQALICV